jgi:acetoin utilization deacetylase AcuC-like enzyme
MTATGVVWDPIYLAHVTDDSHPEHPRRLEPIYRHLQDPAVNGRFTSIHPPAATDEQILLVHSPAYLAQVKATATVDSSTLSADTLTCDRSYAAAATAVGGTIEADQAGRCRDPVACPGAGPAARAPCRAEPGHGLLHLQ